MNKDKVGVVGLGLLGRGIASCFLAHHFEVVAVDLDAGQHEAARKQIQLSLEELVAKGRLSPELVSECSCRLQFSTDYQPLHGCTFVVESVTENGEVKKLALQGIETALNDPDVVIASNTSAIPITNLQASLQHPARLVGMHWAEPAHFTRFTELIRGEQTSDDAFKAAETMAIRLGKDPSLVQKDSPGFIVNRIAYAMYRVALQIISEGPQIHELHRVCRWH